MPKLSDIKIDTSRFLGKGLRPWVTNAQEKGDKKGDKIEKRVTNAQEKGDKKGDKIEKRVTNAQEKGDKIEKRVTNAQEKGDKKGDKIEKRVTNAQEKGDKIEKRVTNAQEKGDKKGDKIEKRVTNAQEKGDKIEKRVTNAQEKGDKKGDKNLTALEAKFIAEINCFNNQKKVKIQLYEVADNLGVSIDTAKKIIGRLKCKNAIEIIQNKKGRGGWAKYKINRYFLQKTAKNSLYNNSSLNKKTITIEKKEKKIFEQKDHFGNSILPPEWEQIDTGPMENVGLTKNKLLDIFKSGNISAEGVQESINHFAWGYEHNSKNYQYKNLLAVFIGALRKGSLWSETGYESPKALALKKVLELKKKQQAEEDQLIDELVSTEFPEWESKLTDAEKEKILPNNHGIFVDRLTKQNQLKSHYRNKILLPRLQKEKII